MLYAALRWMADVLDLLAEALAPVPMYRVRASDEDEVFVIAGDEALLESLAYAAQMRGAQIEVREVSAPRCWVERMPLLTA